MNYLYLVLANDGLPFCFTHRLIHTVLDFTGKEPRYSLDIIISAIELPMQYMKIMVLAKMSRVWCSKCVLNREFAPCSIAVHIHLSWRRRHKLSWNSMGSLLIGHSTFQIWLERILTKFFVTHEGRLHSTKISSQEFEGSMRFHASIQKKKSFPLAKSLQFAQNIPVQN